MPRVIHLGWDGPALPRAAEVLHQRFGNDFDGVTIALPGARAGRRLEELLMGLCKPSWIPPRIATIGPATDALVRFMKPRASGLARELAWVKALKAVPKSELEAITKRRPADEDFAGWAALAGQVRALHQELAAECKRFADVVLCEILPARERERWQALARAQQAYADLIEGCELGDPHLERLRALETGAPLRTPKALVLVGVTTVNGLQRELLRRADAQGVELHALIVAPEAEAGHYDEYGFVRTEAWSHRAVPLDDARWRVADRPADQAAEAAAFLAAACGGKPDGRASVAVLQAEVAPFLARRLSELDSGLRPSVGRSIAETAPGRLLDALRAFLEGRQPRAFAALVRHPDLATALATDGDVSAACDAYLAEHLPARLDGNWPKYEENEVVPWHVARLRSALRDLEQCCAELADGAKLPITDWPQVVGRCLRDVFTHRLDREAAAAVERLAAALDEVAALPSPLAAERIGGADFLRLVMHACGSDTLAPDPAQHGLEQLGWLELPLDEAPALVVTGFQLGAAPEAVHGHPFLPESLRVALGLPSNDDRRARDVCALHVLVHARERVLFVSGQRGTAGDPWLPSPLVFQGADAAARVKQFFRAPAQRAAPTGGTTTAWTPPVPPPPAPREQSSFSASQLTLYTRSPRLYWLQRVLGLETVEPEPHEMDALVFGTFAHEVLATFAQDPATARLRDADAIGGAVRKRMRELADHRFGPHPQAAVRLQLAQLEGRLLAWAGAEAASRAEGWETIHSEWDVKPSVACTLDGEEFGLHGRIDRVDQRERGGQLELRVLDYKAGDKPTAPDKAFMPQAQRWVDLQLPVYRRIAQARFPEAATVTVGWFNLPRGVEDVGIVSPRWSDDAFAAADEAMLAAVRGIRAGEYRPLGNPDVRTLAPAMLALLGVAPADDEESAAQEESAE